MINKWMLRHVALWAVLVFGGCTTLPSGPSVLVLPASGKPFEQFQFEDTICRQWAGKQVGMSAQAVADQNAVKGAVVGTAIGAGAGALIGSASGQSGSGAAIGAGSGLLVGSAAGAGAGREYGWQVQQQYDYAYVQCMYAKGNQVPSQVHQYRIRRNTSPPPPAGRGSVPPDYVPGAAPPAW